VLLAERYRLGDPVGRGGMGVVYRATDEVLGREVAIKLLLPTREGAAAVERFRREARAAAMVSDPHVVATYDFGPHGDGYYLAMELVEGSNVSVELKLRGPLATDRALEIVRQAAAGLAAAHRHGLIHRDIKPANLMLTPDGLVKVADFGIVRILGDTPTTLTATGQIVGTSHYLAPERAQGQPAEAASDVYALGCVLYQLVTGNPPFTADDPAAVMYQHVRADPTPPSELRAELAGDFEALLFWMMAKDPAARPPHRWPPERPRRLPTSPKYCLHRRYAVARPATYSSRPERRLSSPSAPPSAS
jgi:eukaryotic-like serine/threonine-protein kinase